ncbi:unnamed protein product [Rhizophagus irregularis]|nr:unnamed protein product [Rhizophagus irregularis]
MNEVLLQNQKFSNLEKPKMEEEITQLEQKIIEKEHIEMQLEQRLIDLDYECIKNDILILQEEFINTFTNKEEYK